MKKRMKAAVLVKVWADGKFIKTINFKYLTRAGEKFASLCDDYRDDDREIRIIISYNPKRN